MHIVFEAEGRFSAPICGKPVTRYRMTCNVPLGNLCRNCKRVLDATGGRKVKRQFYEFLLGSEETK